MRTPRSQTGLDNAVRPDGAEPDPPAVDNGTAVPAHRPDYAIGYGKPPAGSRFQAGRSGNPKGRPRGDLAFKTLLRRELDERVAVKDQGRRRKLSKRGVIVKRLVSEAMAGNPKHLAIVLAQDPVAAEVLDEVTAALTRPADDAVRAGLIARLRAAAAATDERFAATHANDAADPDVSEQQEGGT